MSRDALTGRGDGPRSREKVCDNVGDHLIGNVYARYEWETEAQAAVDNLNDRWYAGAWQTIVQDPETPADWSTIGVPRQAGPCTPSYLP